MWSSCLETQPRKTKSSYFQILLRWLFTHLQYSISICHCWLSQQALFAKQKWRNGARTSSSYPILKQAPLLCSMAEAHGKPLPKKFQGQRLQALLWSKRQSTSHFLILNYLTKPSLSKVSCCIRHNSLPKRWTCDETSEGKKHECKEILQFQSTSCSQPEEQEVKPQLRWEPQESGKQFLRAASGTVLRRCCNLHPRMERAQTELKNPWKIKWWRTVS